MTGHSSTQPTTSNVRPSACNATSRRGDRAENTGFIAIERHRRRQCLHAEDVQLVPDTKACNRRGQPRRLSRPTSSGRSSAASARLTTLGRQGGEWGGQRPRTVGDAQNGLAQPDVPVASGEDGLSRANKSCRRLAAQDQAQDLVVYQQGHSVARSGSSKPLARACSSPRRSVS